MKPERLYRTETGAEYITQHRNINSCIGCAMYDDGFCAISSVLGNATDCFELIFLPANDVARAAPIASKMMGEDHLVFKRFMLVGEDS